MKRPVYKGAGNHSVKELEDIAEQFDTFCSEQQIVKQDLLKIINSATKRMDTARSILNKGNNYNWGMLDSSDIKNEVDAAISNKQ